MDDLGFRFALMRQGQYLFVNEDDNPLAYFTLNLG